MFLISGRTEPFLSYPKDMIRSTGDRFFQKEEKIKKGGNLGKSNNEYASFTLRGTSDWDRTGGTPFNGSPHVWAMRKSDVRKSQWADGNLEFEVVDSGSIATAPDSSLVIAARDLGSKTLPHSQMLKLGKFLFLIPHYRIPRFTQFKAI